MRYCSKRRRTARDQRRIALGAPRTQRLARWREAVYSLLAVAVRHKDVARRGHHSPGRHVEGHAWASGGACPQCGYENGLPPNRLLTLSEILNDSMEYNDVMLDLFLKSLFQLLENNAYAEELKTWREKDTQKSGSPPTR